MKDVTIRQLRAVAAIARTGKITLAAHDLCLTPPAVTEQLKLLEERLGLRLFQRTSSGLLATDAGRQLVETAARMEALFSEAGDQFAPSKGLRAAGSTSALSARQNTLRRASSPRLRNSIPRSSCSFASATARRPSRR